MPEKDWNRISRSSRTGRPAFRSALAVFTPFAKSFQHQISKALPLWRLWIDGEEVDRFRQRVARLKQMIDPLRALIRRIETLEGEIQRFVASTAAGPPEHTKFVTKLSFEWKSRLDRLVKQCARPEEVERDEEKCIGIEGELAETREALYQLREAERIVEKLASNPRAAELAANLPLLRARLYATGASPAWIEEIKRLVEPVKPLADRVDDPPAEFQTFTGLLTELRSWARQLGVSDGDIKTLEEKRINVATMEPAEIQQVVERAQLLRDRFFADAEKRRDSLLEGMETAIADLRLAGVDPSQIEVLLIALRSRPFTRPHAYREWLDEHEKLRQFFNATAQADRGLLERRLQELTERVEKKLDELSARPVPIEINEAAAVLHQKLRSIPDSPSIEEILPLLGRIRELEPAVDDLIRRRDEELRGIEKLQEQLLAEHAILRESVARVKVVRMQIADFASEIATADGEDSESLEDRRRRVNSWAAQLAAYTLDFLERCRQYIRERLLLAQRVVDVLQRAGVLAMQPALPEIEAATFAPVAAQTLVDARRFHYAVMQKAKKVSVELDSRLDQAKEQLAGLTLDDLVPGDRRTAEQLLADVSDGVSSRILLERVDRSAALLRRCDAFFDRLMEEQRRAVERLEILRQRYRELNEEHLDRYFPEIAQRLTALIEGVPEASGLWNAVHQQLDQATTLFGCIDGQARRIAAEDLRRDADALRHLPIGNDASLQQAVESVLTDLDSYGEDVLPPVSLRMRVRSISQKQV